MKIDNFFTELKLRNVYNPRNFFAELKRRNVS